MKKIFCIGVLCLMVVGVSTALFASGRSLNNNMSAEWAKTLNRYASTDVDAAFFNPAGTAFMPDGFHMYLGDEVIYQPVDLKVRGGDTSVAAGVGRGEYKGTKAAWYFPMGYMVLKKDRFSIAGGSGGVGGGGVAKFKNGLQQLDSTLNTNPVIGVGALINNVYSTIGLSTPLGSGPVFSKVWASSSVYNIQLCLAYEVIKDKLSISLGGRYLIGNTDVDINLHTSGAGANWGGYIPGGSDMHAYQLGMAGGIIVGLCAQPSKDLTIGITGTWNSPLNLRTKSFQALIIGIQDSGFKNSGRSAQQLPGQIAIGIAYRVNGLQISPSFSYQFNQFGQWKGKEKGYTGGYDAGIGFDYTFTSVPLNIGVGYLYAFSGCRPSSRDQLHEELDSHSVSLGFTINLSDTMKLTIGEVYTHYVPLNVNEGAMSSLKLLPAKFYKESTLTAIGITTKI